MTWREFIGLLIPWLGQALVLAASMAALFSIFWVLSLK